MWDMRLIRVVIIRYYIVLVDAWWMDYCVYYDWGDLEYGKDWCT
jgi:hypothetical protein